MLVLSEGALCSARLGCRLTEHRMWEQEKEVALGPAEEGGRFPEEGGEI